MRTCQSCGRENPADRDFCQCGEYLNWDPTGFVEAITPEMAAAAAAEAAAPATPAPAAPAQPGAASAGVRGRAAAGCPPPVAAGPARDAGPRGRAAAGGAGAGARGARARGGDDHAAAARGRGGQGRDARGRGAPRRAHARARDDPQPVGDRRQLPDLRDGLPDEWFSVLPDTVYLVPYGTGGTYEQEVEIHLHPPRKPEAEARIWELEVTAHSKAQERTAATAPLMLGIQPFEQHDTKVKPERASGRRKADFKVAVANKANAPVYVAFAAKEADDDLDFKFTPPGAEIAPGETIETRMRVRPPKQIWIGRPHERRIDVQTKTGEEAQAIEAQAIQETEAEAEAAEHEGLDGEGVARQAQGQEDPRHVRPAGLQAAGLQAQHQPRPRRHPGVQADGPRPAGRGPAGARDEPQPQQPQDARRASAARRSPARCCRPRPSSARSRGCPGGSRS